jgi:pimeloyl-ACP methyl ester carboxylesterase
MRRAGLLRSAVAAFAIAGCTLAAHADERTEARSFYVREDAARRIVIVFIHGGAGSAQATWKHPEAGEPWPAMVAGDDAFRGASIFVYNYATPWFKKALSIHELGVEMRTVLRDRGVLDHQELVFVAHSMGGLVVKAFLLTFREHVQRTKFIYFFGVPSKGTELTRVARYLTENPQSREVVSVETGSYLERQLIDWRGLHTRAPRFPVYCAYETVPAPVYGAIVVDFSSAIEGCFEPPEAIVADHREMVKPKGRETTAYVLLRDKYRRETARTGIAALEGTRQVAAEYLAKGLAAASQGNHLGAIEMYHLAIKADERYERAYFWRGQAFATLGKSERAVDDLKKALELTLDDPADRLLAQRMVTRLAPAVAVSRSFPGLTRSLPAEPSPAPLLVADPGRLLDQLFSDDAATRVRATAQLVLLAGGDAKLLPELLDRAGGATADLGVTLNVLAALSALPPEAVSRHREDVLRYLDAAREAGPQAADYVTLIRSTLVS